MSPRREPTKKCDALECATLVWTAAFCRKHKGRVSRAKVTEYTGVCEFCGSGFTAVLHGAKRKYCQECSPPGTQGSFLSRRGITEQMRDAIYFDQDGQCAMPGCEKEAEDLDHWHGCPNHTDYYSCIDCIRALVCTGCNVKLGMYETSQAACEEYLREWSMA